MSRRLTFLLVGAAMGALTLTYSSAALADDGFVCEFPAQFVQLQRTVNIMNSAPQVVEVQTDVCGNVIGYTEQMTRTMDASPWTTMDSLMQNQVNIHDLSGYSYDYSSLDYYSPSNQKSPFIEID